MLSTCVDIAVAQQDSPAPISLQVIVLSHARDLLYTSSDAGRSWNKHKLPVQNFETSALHLSRKSSQHLVLHSQDQKVSVDGAPGS